MDYSDFKRQANAVTDWSVDYLKGLETLPVKPPVKPGEIAAKIPDAPPAAGEAMEKIFQDFQDLILPGMTHWQHPNFYAYFPANTSPPSLLAEMAMAAMGANCMSWQTSPAATELEIKVVDWLRQAIGLPEGFTGSIQDTASAATLNTLIAAREQATGFESNKNGLAACPTLTAYCSVEAHSSVEKAAGLAGLGRANLRAIRTDDAFALLPAELEAAIKQDIAEGKKPCFVTATLGTTGVGGIDPLRAIGVICRKYDIWLHVDAAWAGSALILPEQRGMIDGIELADSFVFNPHKWLMTHFDCSVLYVSDPGKYVPAFEILPEYLKTREGSEVVNFRDWGIALGRRFRALKLWFVIRYYGMERLQDQLRNHIAWTARLAGLIEAHPDFELTSPVVLGLLSFRYCPKGADNETALDALNEKLIAALNDSGKAYFTQTRAKDKYVIRIAIGSIHTEWRHVEGAWHLIEETAKTL